MLHKLAALMTRETLSDSIKGLQTIVKKHNDALKAGDLQTAKKHLNHYIDEVTHAGLIDEAIRHYGPKNVKITPSKMLNMKKFRKDVANELEGNPLEVDSIGKVTPYRLRGTYNKAEALKKLESRLKS